MESRELRIGNYVEDNNGFVFNVVSIHDDGTVYCDFKENEGDVWEFDKNNTCKGIELTEEIILKCGFDKQGFYFLNRNSALMQMEISLSRKCFISSLLTIEIKHIHQLQNLYYALTGEELQINL